MNLFHSDNAKKFEKINYQNLISFFFLTKNKKTHFLILKLKLLLINFAHFIWYFAVRILNKYQKLIILKIE